MVSNKLDTGSRDAISWLPDEVLGNILSLLPNKLAASTSLLAKKWRHVFRSPSDLYIPLWPVIRESFRNFVDRTLALQFESPINKFSLKYHVNNSSDVVNERRWISNVVDRCVLEVDVSLMPGSGVSVDVDDLFRSETLVKLSLGTDLDLGVPPDVYLPALKSLFIDSIVFDYKDLCDVLLPGCPMLEELTVRHEYEFYPYSLSSQSIKKLTVYYDCEAGIDSISDMSFDAPSLVSLDYTDYALSEYPLVNLESLVRAKLNLCYSRKIERPDLTGLVTGISNVEILYLSPASADVIARCVKDGLVLPVFKNLISLTFGSYNERGWKLLLDLLKQSPKLETLIVQGLDGYVGDVRIRPFQVKVEEL
ncbi:hypothetical protein BRARA_I04124, partial [Brassica rapa]